jgi:CheY-like chemotaxis protein
MARILAVEDEALVRMLIVQTLEDEGHAVLEAEDGEAALSIVAAEKDLDLIVTDVRMPRLGGYELAFAVRDIRPGTLFIFMTGYSKQDLPAELSASRFLQKPFDPDILVSAVEAALKRRDGGVAV